MHHQPPILTLWRNYTSAATTPERVEAQAAIEGALRGNGCAQALDEVGEALMEHVQHFLDRLLGDDLNTGSECLSEIEGFVRENFSVTEPQIPRGQRIPKGVLLTREAKARGPLLALARAARELLPSVKKLLECRRLLEEVRQAQKERADTPVMEHVSQ
jgi:hypothetical protein